LSASKQVIAGFIPLLDAAVLVAARERGFAEAAGLELKLVRETSWASIRDRMAVGHFDVAHMLAPMPIAAALKLTSLPVPMCAALVLGLGGNAISVSRPVADEMEKHGWDRSLDPAKAGVAVAALVGTRRRAGHERLRFGVVHPYSGHAYELRYWLAASGLDPDRDAEITVLPPSFMPDALRSGQLDGYCVGEPWNTVSIRGGHGVMVTCKQAIWPNSPEKVLGVTEAWAKANTETLAALVQALSNAAAWCAEPGHTEELAEILGRPEYLDCEPSDCLPALTGLIETETGRQAPAPDFFRFVSGPDALPRTDHALWFYSQMVRWKQAEYSAAAAATSAAAFACTTARRVLQAPDAEGDILSAPVTFFDGGVFEGAALAEYVAEFDAGD
jgi:ABC-type nitrate/sulfonate/bicarbonate transport system substrate-binding protein